MESTHSATVSAGETVGDRAEHGAQEHDQTFAQHQEDVEKAVKAAASYNEDSQVATGEDDSEAAPEYENDVDTKADPVDRGGREDVGEDFYYDAAKQTVEHRDIPYSENDATTKREAVESPESQALKMQSKLAAAMQALSVENERVQAALDGDENNSEDSEMLELQRQHNEAEDMLEALKENQDGDGELNSVETDQDDEDNDQQDTEEIDTDALEALKAKLVDRPLGNLDDKQEEDTTTDEDTDAMKRFQEDLGEIDTATAKEELADAPEECQDVAMNDGTPWVDKNKKSCKRYALEAIWCDSYGAGNHNGGYCANEACCICGGGLIIIKDY